MPDLKFDIISAEVKPFAAVPTLSFKLRITNGPPDEEVFAAALKCQVIIEAHKRVYDAATKENLYELFGKPHRWSETLGSVQWAIVHVPVPRFAHETVVEVAIPCSEDQTMAAGKYFYAVREEQIPLAFLFSGTLFYKGADDKVQVTQISWEKEAAYKIPSELWQQMMDAHFPDFRWMRVRKNVYDKLVNYKARSVFPTLEDCLDSLLDNALTETLLIENKNS